MVRSREVHKDFVNWGDGVLSNQDPSEMMKPLIYDELTSVVYAEYRIAKKFVHVCFFSLATLFLLGFSPTFHCTSPLPFPQNASLTSVVAVALRHCTLFLSSFHLSVPSSTASLPSSTSFSWIAANTCSPNPLPF